MSLRAKKIVIVYASAGEGHRRAAQALYNYIKDNYKQIEINIVDVLEYTNFVFKNLYSNGYAFLITRLPSLWKLAYQITYSKILKHFNKNLRYIINRLNTKNFEKFLLKNNPDIVISTHFLVTEAVSFLKRKNILNPYLATVITDFNMHPFWLSEKVDKYMVACEYIKEELVAEGIAENKIMISGIPVDLKFAHTYERNYLCKKLSIGDDMFTVTLVTAGFGLWLLEEIVDLLYKDVQILVVCGKNSKLFRKLESKHYENVKVFGFINNIEELLAVSNIIITKPGGLTISESLAMNLPMIFIAAIAGQETKNVRILEKYRLGFCPSNIKSLRDKVYDYKNNPAQLISIKENISKVRRPYAAKEISDAICQDIIRNAH